ncbi:MarR family winged helix-turn-helix transcriptional regulator [Granulicella cerasi]|uniref:MarR family winged helix-turn-helix transcriptional regulator n=1 Tax=Granulicella cerasi TaxID=741063 RepID=A0ABW1ZCV0_9BACT|nr:MarR family winged helix-turn-helix transcriptional regulator [Granulicella cerasi]
MTLDPSTTTPSEQFPEYLNDLASFRYTLRKFLAFSEVASERAGIQAQQYQLMQVIASIPPEQHTSISYLSERMVLRHNSTVELVDRAERAGLVERRNDARDLRRSLVVLTPKGSQILRTLVKEHTEELKRYGSELLNSLQHVMEAVK